MGVGGDVVVGVVWWVGGDCGEWVVTVVSGCGDW